MSWAAYLPFSSGVDLALEAKLGWVTIRGEARVLACSDILELAFEIPPQTVLLKRITGASGRVRLGYEREGEGNPGLFAVEGEEPTAASVHIESDPDRGRRRLEIELQVAKGGPERVGFTLLRAGPAEARIVELRGIPRAAAGVTIILRPA